MTQIVGDGMEHVRALAAVGKRPTGFAGEARAAEYLCGRLRQWGLANVAVEEFPARSWDFDTCRVHADGLGELAALPVEFSGATGVEGVAGELLVVEDSASVDPFTIRGRVVLTLGQVPAGSLLLDGGAVGLIVADPARPRPWHLIYGPRQPLAGRLPMVTLGFGDAVELVRHRVARVRLQVATTIADVTGRNVVATLAGSGSRRLSVSAHYDSVPSGPAAADNATGTACALEVVRALAQAPPGPPVDVVLFSGEEIGLYGAAAYAERHAAALARTGLGVYFDGQGDFLGRSQVHVLGQAGLADEVRRQLAEIGYRAQVHHHFTGLDQACLSAQGAPTLWFQRGPQLTWHTPADTVDEVSPLALRDAVAAAVHLVRHAAAHPDAYPPGIPADQAQRLQEYLQSGPPCW
ncbi:MAG: M20/M25/M40 family metallo-hydrolase [Candidatus Latescibacterota bacterium]|jgi:hypothetical protein